MSPTAPKNCSQAAQSPDMITALLNDFFTDPTYMFFVIFFSYVMFILTIHIIVESTWVRWRMWQQRQLYTVLILAVALTENNRRRFRRAGPPPAPRDVETGMADNVSSANEDEKNNNILEPCHISTSITDIFIIDVENLKIYLGHKLNKWEIGKRIVEFDIETYLARSVLRRDRRLPVRSLNRTTFMV